MPRENDCPAVKVCESIGNARNYCRKSDDDESVSFSTTAALLSRPEICLASVVLLLDKLIKSPVQV